MKLDHIPLSHLKPCPLNVRRHGSTGGDLIASIRSLGLLQPLLVRSNCEGFEIVAGQRRFAACQALEAQGMLIGSVPCLIMEAGEDAAAIEASLAENIARLPMDEIDQYEAFAALIAEGRSVTDIAAHFGVTERLVQQRLAIAHLYDPILNAYRRGEIEPATLRTLTMATTRQQKAWWKLHKDEAAWAPTGRALKEWLFGGHHIPVGNALFDLADYDGAIITDLFSEDRFFADSAQFWTLQSRAVAALSERYRAEGWAEVIVHEAGEHWASWNHVHTAKEEGGHVHITCTADGEVVIHEGYLSAKEASRRARQRQEGGKDGSAARPELTKAMQNYLALHRHAAVRVQLLGHPQTALRLMLAHAIAGSALWCVQPEPQKANSHAIRDSIEISPAEVQFAAEREEISRLLSIGDDGPITGHGWRERSLPAIFARLLELPDSDVLRILAFVMAETLEAGTGLIEALGQQLGVDMQGAWQPDEVFFELLRDKQVINAMVAELAGRPAAEANLTATAKVQKGILRDCLNGTRRPQAERWQPRYMAFPMAAYTDRGGIAAMAAWEQVAEHLTGTGTHE